MKITTLELTFSNPYTFEEMYQLIFSPISNVSSIIKCFRRYRIYIVSLAYISNKVFSFSFHFPSREILLKFREEFTQAAEEVPK